MTEEEKRRILAGFLERAQIADERNLPATAKSWRDRHNNLMVDDAEKVILAQGATAMRISTAFPSEYLKAADLQGRNVRVIIDRVEMRDVGDDHKPVLFFQGKDKGVVLNKTNANNIALAYGDDTDEWQGKEVVLFEAMVDFQGRSVAAIRIRPPMAKDRPKPALKVAAAAAPSENPADPSDEIPF